MSVALEELQVNNEIFKEIYQGGASYKERAEQCLSEHLNKWQ